MRAVWFLVLAGACEPPSQAATPAPPATALASEPQDDGCRRDIPDCSAACSLRATHHTEFIDWYDRRCAAVILGKNPDKAAGAAPPDLDVDAGTLTTHAADDLIANPYR
jgi:hypothetical protein